MWWRLLLLWLGVFAVSTSVLFIKASEVDAILLPAHRLVFAAAILSPLFLRELSVHRQSFRLVHLRRAILPALFLALHFISWTAGARLTTAANASLIVNMIPVAMPFFLFLFLRETVNRAEIIGTLLAVSGVVILMGGDYVFSPDHLPGDLTCFLSMLLFALYLALGRLNRDVPSLWLYLVPLYAFAGFICFAAGIVAGRTFTVYPAREYLLLLGVAVVPTVVGHSLLNYSLKHLRGQIVSISASGQFIAAAMMAFFLFREVPEPVFYLAATLILWGTIIAVRAASGGCRGGTAERTARRTGSSAS